MAFVLVEYYENSDKIFGAVYRKISFHS